MQTSLLADRNFSYPLTQNIIYTISYPKNSPINYIIVNSTTTHVEMSIDQNTWVVSESGNENFFSTSNLQGQFVRCTTGNVIIAFAVL